MIGLLHTEDKQFLIELRNPPLNYSSELTKVFQVIQYHENCLSFETFSINIFLKENILISRNTIFTSKATESENSYVGT